MCNSEKIKFIENIKDGLVEAALSTEVWIITNGLDNVFFIKLFRSLPNDMLMIHNLLFEDN